MNKKYESKKQFESSPELSKNNKIDLFSGVQLSLLSVLLIAIYTTVIKLIEVIQDTYGLGSFFGISGRAVLSLWPFYLYIGFLSFLTFANKRYQNVIVRVLKQISDKTISRLGYVNFLFYLFLIGLYCLKYFIDLDIWLYDDSLSVFVFFHFGLLGAILIRAIKEFSLLTSLVMSFSGYGLILFTIFWIPAVHSYPLTMGWSEGSRYYYASLFFSERLYGFQIPLPSMHPSRYLMQSAPFLIPNASILVHRLWQVLLWIALPVMCGIALVRRIKPGKKWFGLAIVAWFTLFIFQGPVYYHLLVVILIVLLGFNREKLGLSILFVILASMWAGISRINWFPVAGMLAATLYILEIPQEKKSFWMYWGWPVGSVFVGLFSAFVAQLIYVFLSGRTAEQFTSSFSSPLLFYRLFPNDAFGPGVLLLLLIASFFSIIILLRCLLPKLHMWRPLRLLGLLSILLALMVSGIIVSTKIGGGNNLHNLDAFLVVLAVIIIYVLFFRFIQEDQDQIMSSNLPAFWVLLSVLGLMINLVGIMRHYPSLDNNRAWRDIEQIQALIEEKVPEGGEVLFIHNRHLLTFNMIEGVEMVPEYEKIFLMEMAMSENEAYLSAFKNDISQHRFDLIVMEPLFLGIKDSSEHFAEENNAWVIHVAIPLNQSYQSIFEPRGSALSVMVPKVAD